MADSIIRTGNVQDEHGVSFSARKYVCVCVCVRERENLNIHTDEGICQRDTTSNWKNSQWPKLEQFEQQNE